MFSNYGLPDILHSDQGRNFESTILRQTLEAFGVKKTRTTAYHPQGDGMVERFNRSLLQLLRAYVECQSEWEQYLPFILFAYRTAVHTSTGISPFELMFGRPPVKHQFPPTTAYDAVSYQSKLRSKLSQLSDFVETHLIQAAQKQKSTYDHNTLQRPFTVGDQVWLARQIGSQVGGAMANTINTRPNYLHYHRWRQNQDCTHQPHPSSNPTNTNT